MSDFIKIKPEELSDNVIKLIGSDWMLITSANDGDSLVGGQDYNTMTASWGGLGVLWHKPVAFIFIRPQRHTFSFAERNTDFTLSFFDESFRPALSYCGKFSGRDFDKAKECSLTPVSDNTECGRRVWFAEARIVLKVKKLYADFIHRDCLTDPAPLSTYAAGDFHKMFICEIEETLVKK